MMHTFLRRDLNEKNALHPTIIAAGTPFNPSAEDLARGRVGGEDDTSRQGKTGWDASRGEVRGGTYAGRPADGGDFATVSAAAIRSPLYG